MKKILILIILFGAISVNNVFSADFTFNVPVNYSSLPDEIDHMRVDCRIYFNATAPDHPASTSLKVGKKTVSAFLILYPGLLICYFYYCSQESA